MSRNNLIKLHIGCSGSLKT